MIPKKLTNEIVDIRLEGRNIKRLDEYINAQTKIAFQCLIDGYVWKSTPYNIMTKENGCPKCHNCIPYDNAIIDEKLKNRNIKRLGNFVASRIKMEFQCLIDGYKWLATPNNIFGCGCGCPICGGSAPLTADIIDERLIGKSIKRLGTYINDATKIEFQCLIDGYKWLATPNNILQGRGCPNCSFGKSEKQVMNLINKHILYDVFVHHKPFLFNNRKYVPDFYLEIGTNKIIIEYNGAQHYKPAKFHRISKQKAKNNFIKQQKRDAELRQYCQENNIYLLEISYTWKEDKTIDELKKINDQETRCSFLKSPNSISSTSEANV